MPETIGNEKNFLQKRNEIKVFAKSDRNNLGFLHFIMRYSRRSKVMQETTGKVNSVKNQWWLKVNTKPVRMNALDWTDNM